MVNQKMNKVYKLILEKQTPRAGNTGPGVKPWPSNMYKVLTSIPNIENQTKKQMNKSQACTHTPINLGGKKALFKVVVLNLVGTN